MHFAATPVVYGKGLVGKLLHYLELFTAIFALVFVKRHINF